MIDGSEKHNGWLNFELQSPHVIERCSNRASLLITQVITYRVIHPLVIFPS